MEIVYVILLLIFFLVMILTTPDDEQIVMANDYDYFNRFSDKSMRQLINNNKINEPIIKKNKILFITYDNRVNEDYVEKFTKGAVKGKTGSLTSLPIIETQAGDVSAFVPSSLISRRGLAIALLSLGSRRP